MPVAESPPPWIAPVSPVVVERRFRVGAPYAAGGHRGIDLRVVPGSTVRSPCSGRVSFRGRVAGGPQTVTIACGSLRATLQRVSPAVQRGDHVRRGTSVGIAAGTAVDLSARLPNGTYLDPLPLLGAATRHRVPPIAARGPRSPARAGRGRSRPAALPPGALVLPLGVGASPGSDARSGPGASLVPRDAPDLDPTFRAHGSPVDWPLAAGAGLAVLAASLVGLRSARRSARARGRTARLPIAALVARDRR